MRSTTALITDGRSSGSDSARNPMCPRLTPRSGTSWSRARYADRRIVPSPPNTSANSQSAAASCRSAVSTLELGEPLTVCCQHSHRHASALELLDRTRSDICEVRSTTMGYHQTVRATAALDGVPHWCLPTVGMAHGVYVGPSAMARSTSSSLLMANLAVTKQSTQHFHSALEQD